MKWLPVVSSESQEGRLKPRSSGGLGHSSQLPKRCSQACEHYSVTPSLGATGQGGGALTPAGLRAGTENQALGPGVQSRGSLNCAVTSLYYNHAAAGEEGLHGF